MLLLPNLLATVAVDDGSDAPAFKQLNMPLTGDPVNDLSGLHSLVITSGVTLGGVGEGLIMNGAAEAYVTSSAHLAPTGDYTLSVDALMYSSLADAVLLSSMTADQGSGFRLATKWNTYAQLAFVVNHTSNANNYVESSGASFIANVWHRVEVQRVGPTTTIYLNGVAIGSDDVPTFASGSENNVLHIGYNPANGNRWRGQLKNLSLVHD